MVAALEAVAGVEIVNAQSNYVLVKVEGSAAEVAQRLLAESNVLVRDLSDDDKGEIIGIAVSQSVEPAQLANAFAHVCRK